MFGEYDIFDEWGRFIGSIRPAGSGCASVGGVIFLYVFLFLIYIFIMLIVKGVKALFSGHLLVAFVYLSVPSLVIGLISYSEINEYHLEREYRSERNMLREARDIEVEKFLSNPPKALDLSALDSVNCNDAVISSMFSNLPCDVPLIGYTATNPFTYLYVVVRKDESCYYYDPTQEHLTGDSIGLGPHEEFNVVCPELESKDSFCLNVFVVEKIIQDDEVNEHISNSPKDFLICR